MLETCAQNFARKGDPWLTERERAELQAQLLPTRGGARKAKERVRYCDRFPERRELNDVEAQARHVRENMLAIRQLIGNHPRDQKPLGPEALPLLRRVYHPMKEEMIRFPSEAEVAEADAKHQAWLAAERAEVERRRANKR